MACCDLTEYILKHGGDTRDISIGIITPYQEQVREIRYILRDRISLRKYNITISSVDGFQGQEKDFIIFSSVRAHKSSSSSIKKGKSNIGFVADLRRMNVGITRAKYCLFIVGCAEVLKSDESWKSLIEDAQDRNRFIHLPRENTVEFLNNGLRKSNDSSHNAPPLASSGIKYKKRKKLTD